MKRARTHSTPERSASARRTAPARPLGFTAALLALAATLAAPPAFAQDAAALLADGKKLMKEGKLAEACPKLEESQKVAPRSSTLLEVAACHEKQGKIATAWSEYIDVAGDARKEGNKRLEADAKGRGAKLELRLPRVTITVPPNAAAIDGLEVKIDGAPIDRSGWGQSRPIDPGDHKVTASAPGRKSWEFAVSVKVAERKGVTVPALAEDASAAAAPPKPIEQLATKADPEPTVVGATTAPPPAEAPITTHQAGRVVVDVGVAGGLLVGVIERGSLDDLNTYYYNYQIPQGELIAACTEDLCHTAFDAAAGGFIGGQAFVGYALTEELQLGARLLGGYRFGGGFLLAGGPSGSMKVGPVWLGLTLMVGGVEQSAKVAGIKGEIPQEVVELNGGKTEIDVNIEGKNVPEEAPVGTLAFGGALEVSYVLLDLPGSGWSSGSLMVSAFPTFMKGLEGFAFAVPISLGYRFY